jgi:predicted permease
MDFVRTLMSRLKAQFGRHQLDRDLDEELCAHIDLAIEENLKQGMSMDKARTAALKTFGGVTQTREAYRMQRGMPLIDEIARDIRFSTRQSRRSPGFALTAILTLALGLGANTAVFSLINGLLLRPLPVPHADELALIHIERSTDGLSGPNYSFSSPLFRALEKRHDVFEDVAAIASQGKFQVRGANGNEHVPGSMVSGEFFSAMQIRPRLGRVLTPEDDRPGGTETGFGVVITEDFWHQWFNGAPDVVGRPITIANTPFTVVGVLPRSFIGTDPTRRPQIYAPLWAEPLLDAPYNHIAGGYQLWWMRVIARRKPGVSLDQANAALRAASNLILDEAIPDAKWIKDAREEHFQLVAEPGSKGYSYLRLMFLRPLSVVFALCAAMLLLACLNLASLLMARSASRERELATRLALGATRRRLIQQLLIESLLITLLATAAGMMAAPAFSQSLAGLILSKAPDATLDTSLDMRVFAFIALAAIAAAVLIGLIPALRATSKNLNEQIKIGSQASSARERRRLLPRILMGLEVALALILVVGAGLLATSLARLYRTGLGFDPKNVVNLRLDMGKQSLEGAALIRWYQAYGDALGHLPGVTSVSFSSDLPLSGSMWITDCSSPLSGGDRQTYMNSIAPDYFLTMHIPLLAGRDFRWNDTLSGGEKIIISQTAAKYQFPGEDPIGQHVVDSYDHKSYEVIGVVGDSHYTSIRESAPPAAYLSLTQTESKKPSYGALLRINGPAAPLTSAARGLTARMAPEIPAPVLTTMSDELDASISSERMMAMLSIFFAGSALLVTAIGLYGTLAYATARRTSEIGIRMALGAQRIEVVALVFAENAWVALCGSFAGLVAALFASRVLASILYGTSARDPWVLVGSVTVLTLISSAASVVPALRAARIDPMRALRTD